MTSQCWLPLNLPCHGTNQAPLPNTPHLISHLPASCCDRLPSQRQQRPQLKQVGAGAFVWPEPHSLTAHSHACSTEQQQHNKQPAGQCVRASTS